MPLPMPSPSPSRIDTTFAKARSENRAVLVTYVMAGDPDPETSLEVLLDLGIRVRSAVLWIKVCGWW